MTGLYRKKALVEARRFDMTGIGEQAALADWCQGDLRGLALAPEKRCIKVRTNHGEVMAEFGDWIVKGTHDFYPCADEVFLATYELVAKGGGTPDGSRHDYTFEGSPRGGYNIYFKGDRIGGARDATVAEKVVHALNYAYGD